MTAVVPVAGSTTLVTEPDPFDLDLVIVNDIDPRFMPKSCDSSDGCGSTCPSACVSEPIPPAGRM
jgi:FxLD family lantipeptide